MPSMSLTFLSYFLVKEMAYAMDTIMLIIVHPALIPHFVCGDISPCGDKTSKGNTARAAKNDSVYPPVFSRDDLYVLSCNSRNFINI